MKNRYRHQTEKAITVRFSIEDFLDIESEAEERGTNLANMLRIAWMSHKTGLDFDEKLENFRRNLYDDNFKISCVVAGLTEDEIRESRGELFRSKHNG